jgi:hypothetical protein
LVDGQDFLEPLWILYHKGFFLVIPYNAIVLFIVPNVACAVGPSVATSSTDFSFQNLVFWNLFEFSVAET